MGRTKVLAVDDNEDNLDLIEEYLDTTDCAFVRATNGREAIDLARANPPDVVLLDLIMPDMDGYAVYEALQSDLLLRDIPVILITAYGSRDNVFRAIGLGLKPVLCKPVGRQRLLAEIKRCVGQDQLVVDSAPTSTPPRPCEVTPQASPVSEGTTVQPGGVERAVKVIKGAVLEHAVDVAERAPEIGELIGEKTELGQRIIRQANCATFGGLHRVSSVPAAIVRLGMNHTKELIRDTFGDDAEGIRKVEALAGFIDALGKGLSTVKDPEAVLLEQLEGLGVAASLLKTSDE